MVMSGIGNLLLGTGTRMNRAPFTPDGERRGAALPPADFARQLQPQSLQVQGLQRQPPRAAFVLSVMVFLLPGRAPRLGRESPYSGRTMVRSQAARLRRARPAV